MPAPSPRTLLKQSILDKTLKTSQQRTETPSRPENLRQGVKQLINSGFRNFQIREHRKYLQWEIFRNKLHPSYIPSDT
jgi:hypothetical protein